MGERKKVWGKGEFSYSLKIWSLVETWEVALNLYSGAEIRNLLESVGFTKVQLYGHLKGTPYNHSAERLIVVAEKQ